MAALLLGLFLLAGAARAADKGLEFGVEDDLTVLGTEGTVQDPDLEVKGFTVFGATEAFPGVVPGPGNVVINGRLYVSSGTYFVGDSTFTSAANIFIGDGLPGQLLRKTFGGNLYWDNISSLGDNLGNHVATTTLNMAGYQIINVSSLTVTGQDESGYSLWLSSG
ncbi:MAG: hypothetical protein NTY45_00645, partial [Elusimicrobia bacterium]|nr:hypothetical protein [Elusimicrobiota bacterium]